jgi:hypothetical protein
MPADKYLTLVRRLPKKHALTSPSVQLVCAVGVMVGGAWLIALWMVGAVLMAAGVLFAADAVFRDNGKPARPQLRTHEDVLERYRRAR